MTLNLHGSRSSGLPDDEELRVLTNYLGGFMTEAEERDYRQLLAEDEGLARRVAPMVKAWSVGLPPEAAARSAARIKVRREALAREQWKRRRRVGLAGVALAAAAAVTFAMVEVRAPDEQATPVAVIGPVAPSLPVAQAEDSIKAAISVPVVAVDSEPPPASAPVEHQRRNRNLNRSPRRR